MTRIISTILILGLTLTGFSQSMDIAKLDSFFQALETNNKFMGSVALAQNGKILYTKSIGFSDIETQTKPDENTKYRIGSITKTFTTVLVFKAIEENKLNLSDKINTYFPTIKNGEKITIEHLLYHRSGIHSFTSNEDYLKWCTQPKTKEELTEIIVKGGSDFEPDSKAEYSNSNFVLLTFILEKVFNKTYGEILDENILKPLGLKNTYLGKKTSITNNECNSYKFAGDWIKEPETDMSVPLGAGAIVSSPSDLTRFAEALFEGKLISKENLEQMKTIKDNIGMGLFKVPFYDKFGYGHNGGIDGFTSVFSYFPDDKVGYALTSNGTNFNNNNISIAVLSSFYNKPYEIPSFKSYDVTSEDLDKYLGVYSSKNIPLKITVTKKDKTLMAQATGQSSFGLEATGKDIFKFDQAGIVMEFNPNENKMILKQGGGTFNFTKE